MNSWEEIRAKWIMRVGNSGLLSVISEVAGAGSKDDCTGSIHRLQTIAWLSSRGAIGRDWGHAGPFVLEFLSHRPKKENVQ